MMFCVVIGTVKFASLPINVELVLSDSVADPVETHVDGFGSFLFYCVVGDPCGGCVIRSYWGCRLRVSEFFEGYSYCGCFFAVVEECCKFGFGCT